MAQMSRGTSTYTPQNSACWSSGTTCFSEATSNTNPSLEGQALAHANRDSIADLDVAFPWGLHYQTNQTRDIKLEDDSQNVGLGNFECLATEWGLLSSNHVDQMCSDVVGLERVQTLGGQFEYSNDASYTIPRPVGCPSTSPSDNPPSSIYHSNVTPGSIDLTSSAFECGDPWTQYLTESPSAYATDFYLDTKEASEPCSFAEYSEQLPASLSGSDNPLAQSSVRDNLTYPPLPVFSADLSTNWDIHDLSATNGHQVWSNPSLLHLMPSTASSNCGTDWTSKSTLPATGGSIPVKLHETCIDSSLATHISSGHCGSTSRDKSKDQFLLESKAAGMSYKDIKIKGGFVEAESTLRGRYRTLTKPKDARVRRPEWTENDVAILKQTVSRYLSTMNGASIVQSSHPLHHGVGAQMHALDKIPWKQVAESMANRGCYRFGNATVKKKYVEVMGTERAGTLQ